MAKLMNRSRGLAEGVVLMICPVLLALALNMVNLNGKVYGHDVFIATLAIAGATLITGICPLLTCCVCEGFLGPDVSPAPVTAILVTISSSCHLVLACLIALLLVSKYIAIPVVAMFGSCVVARTVCYYRTQNAGQYRERMQDILDESHEFLTGVTGILFLGLEGLALEGDSQMVQKGGPVCTISFIVCALGVCLMFLEMTPPCFRTRQQIVDFTLALDCTMAAGTFTLLLAVMLKLMQRKALYLFLPPAVSLFQLVVLVTFKGNTQDEQAESMPASLELTRVTFTGFLAVWVTAISNASPISELTLWFLFLSAEAIVFGLSWRLLSQMNIRSGLASCASSDHVASAAKLACFSAHCCIVIATILLIFVVMAGKASGK